MPRLHPRQLLAREAVILGLAGTCALAMAIGWYWVPPPALDAPIPAAERIAAANTAVSLPTGSLWHPATDTPNVTIQPAPAPTFRLITLSQRQGTWTALIDPGSGATAERVRIGDAISGWKVVDVSAIGVELTNDTQRLSLRFGP